MSGPGTKPPPAVRPAAATRPELNAAARSRRLGIRRTFAEGKLPLAPAGSDGRRRSSAVALLTAALVAALVAAPVASLWAADWTWKLPVARYKTLDVFQRAQVDKAATLLEQGSFAAAASEFEKFKVQFPDSPVLPYVILMRGYCLHQAKVRNQAIKIYHEVLDYFADEVDDAAAALYFMGVAHIENGDTRKGMQCMKQMIEDEDYAKHPLAAGALAHLADNHWKNKEPEQAVKCWKQIVRDFSQTSHTQANDARTNVTIYYIKTRDYAAYEAWLVNDENREDANHRKWVATNALDRAHHNIFHWHLGHYNRFEQKQRWEAMKACYDYFGSRKVWFEKTNDLWNFYSRALYFLSQHYQDKKARDPLLDQAVALVKTIQDKKDANGRYAWLSDRLREAGDYARAHYCIGLMSDPPYAAYKECEIFFQQSKWKEALARLEQIEKMGNADWAGRALERRAWIHKDYLYQYETAVQLYRQLNNPPWNLWQVQECYIRWGKLDEAITTLSEIENSFPAEASKAAWYKASYYHEAKQAKQAIAQARKILKAYKESKEASQAHQLLEQYGVATGGGVFEKE